MGFKWFNGKKYCFSPCAKDKFQKYVIPAVSLAGAITIGAITLYVVSWLIGIIFTAIMFYGFGVNFNIENLALDSILVTYLLIVCVLLIYVVGVIVYGILKFLYKLVMYDKKYLNNVIEEITTGVLVIITIFALALGAGLVGGFVYILGLLVEIDFWLISSDISIISIIFNGMLVTGVFGALIFITVHIIYGIVNHLYNNINNKVQEKYSTKFRKECKLFIECEEN